MVIDTKLVAILNLTPDSFSDGGSYADTNAALKAIERFAEEGASVIDIGAESTRPGAIPISVEEEWERLSPLLKQLKHIPHTGIQYSIDTRNGENARKALDLGVDWINDVSGFSSRTMIDAVLPYDCMLVVMHSLGVPADKAMVLPEDCDIVELLTGFAVTRLRELEQEGISRKRFIFDPGVGFGKTAPQSWDIINNASGFNALGVPLLVGHSRKSFLSPDRESRDAATLEVSTQLIESSVNYLRVHDVASHRQLLESLMNG